MSRFTATAAAAVCLAATAGAFTAPHLTRPHVRRRTATTVMMTISASSVVRRRAVLAGMPGLIPSRLGAFTPLPPDECGTESSLLHLPPVREDSVRLLLCRHGETEYNRRKLVQGRGIDAPLNAIGRAQARELGSAITRVVGNSPPAGAALPLEPMRSVVVASSTLRRARATADNVAHALTARGFTAERVVLPDLDEVDFGAEDGTSAAPFRERFARYAVGDPVSASYFVGGETVGDVLARAEKALAALTEAARGGGGANAPVAVAVTHSSFLKLVLSNWLALPIEDVQAVGQANCCVNAIDFEKQGLRRPRPLLLNSVCHLHGVEPFPPLLEARERLEWSLGEAAARMRLPSLY